MVVAWWYAIRPAAAIKRGVYEELLKQDFVVYLRMLRVRDWLGYFLIAILGYITFTGLSAPTLDTIWFLTIVSLYLGFSFSINNCFDIKEDFIGMKRKNPVAMGELDQKKGIIFSLSLMLASMFLALLRGLDVFMFYSILAFLSYSYSSPPFRLKSKPFLDIVSHGLFFGALIFLFPSVFFSKQISLLHALIATSIFYFSMILELRNLIEDYEHDKKAGLRTTACLLGLNRSKRITYFLSLSYPLTLFPIYCLLDDSIMLLTFIVLTILFYPLFHLTKSYRILDVYASISYSLIVVGGIL